MAQRSLCVDIFFTSPAFFLPIVVLAFFPDFHAQLERCHGLWRDAVKPNF
jgi:hypothetical protein